MHDLFVTGVCSGLVFVLLIGFFLTELLLIVGIVLALSLGSKATFDQHHLLELLAKH